MNLALGESLSLLDMGNCWRHGGPPLSPGPMGDYGQAIRASARMAAGSVAPAEREKLRALMRSPEAKLSYDFTQSIAFHAEYSEINYAKYRIVVERAGLEHPRAVLDVGAGCGVFAAATADWSRDMGEGLPRFVLLDRSREHLSLASHIFPESIKSTQFDFPTSGGTTILGADFFAWSPAGEGLFDLVLAGHILSENRLHLIAGLERMRGLLSPLGAVLVVEQADDPIWDVLQEAVASVGLQLVLQEELAVHIPDARPLPFRLRWCLLRRSSAWRRALVDRYLAAWRWQEPSMLTGIFAEQAEYREKPFCPAIKGIGGIQEYWRRVVMPQDQPIARVLRCLIVEGDVVVEWRASFDQPLSTPPKNTCIEGVMWCRTSTSQPLFLELKEVFRSVHAMRGV